MKIKFYLELLKMLTRFEQIDPQKVYEIFLNIRSKIFSDLYEQTIKQWIALGSSNNFFRVFKEKIGVTDAIYWNYSDFLFYYFKKKWGIK
mgnify:FL=1